MRYEEGDWVVSERDAMTVDLLRRNKKVDSCWGNRERCFIGHFIGHFIGQQCLRGHLDDDEETNSVSKLVDVSVHA